MAFCHPIYDHCLPPTIFTPFIFSIQIMLWETSQQGRHSKTWADIVAPTWDYHRLSTLDYSTSGVKGIVILLMLAHWTFKVFWRRQLKLIAITFLLIPGRGKREKSYVYNPLLKCWHDHLHYSTKLFTTVSQMLSVFNCKQTIVIILIS